MWFKNLIAYQLDKPFNYGQEELEALLEKNPFDRCSSQQPWTIGWVPPMGRQGELLSHRSRSFTLLTARREERLLPAGVVREAVNEKVETIESEQDRRVGRKEKLEIREELVFDMMPRAFTRSSYISAIIIEDQNLLIVDAASRTRAEEWITLLRETLGSLPLHPLQVKESMSGTFTLWLKGDVQLPEQWSIGDQCELRSTEEAGSVVRFSKHDLSSDELESHFEAGKVAVKLALEWQDSASFVINDALEFKRLKFADRLLEEAATDAGSDAAAQFDANFILMSLELNRFLPAFFELFGGIQTKQD
ncbi:MAG: recombination associated protein RdgC [Parasphingorhabdus sp.]|jgi:recombination associated protein RdgC